MATPGYWCVESDVSNPLFKLESQANFTNSFVDKLRVNVLFCNPDPCRKLIKNKTIWVSSRQARAVISDDTSAELQPDPSSKPVDLSCLQLCAVAEPAASITYAEQVTRAAAVEICSSELAGRPARPAVTQLASRWRQQVAAACCARLPMPAAAAHDAHL